jgi:hypothetical protein
MSSVSRFLFVSALFCAQSVLACGGSTDSHGSPSGGENGENAGASNEGDSAAAGSHSAGAGSHSAGAGSHSAGAPSSDHGNTAGAGSTGSGTGSAGASSTPNGTKLSEIKTDAQALAVCTRIKDAFSDADLAKMVLGSCAVTGQTGAASQQGTCEELQADCAEHTPLPSTNDGSCTADDIPDCDDVTVDEYVSCTRSMMASGIEYLSSITCETDLESLQAPGTPSACRAPFARCPEYAAIFQ